MVKYNYNPLIYNAFPIINIQRVLFYFSLAKGSLFPGRRPIVNITIIFDAVMQVN